MIPLATPRRAEEPASSQVKADFVSGDLKTVHDYDKAQHKVNKVIRSVVRRLVELNKAVWALSTAATQQAASVSSALSLEADLMRI